MTKTDTDSGPSRKKLKRGYSAPKWETTRHFSADKPKRSTPLPVIQDGQVQRNIPQRPKFIAKARRQASNKAGAEKENMKQNLKEEPHVINTEIDKSKHNLRLKTKKRTRRELEEYARKIDNFEDLKIQIASMASKLTAKPEENLGLLKELRRMASALRGKSAALVVLTESKLYIDLSPAYNIRSVTEKEAETKVSKEVAKLRNFEQTLLKSYTSYVHSCMQLSRWTSGGGKETTIMRDKQKVRFAACRALAELVRGLPHFNEASSIASRVCTLVADKDVEVRRYCTDALKSLLRDVHRASGSTLDTSLLVARELANLAAGKANNIPAEAVEPLAEIQFAKFSLLPGSKKAKNERKKGKKFSKKMRRKAKSDDPEESAALARDLNEADAGVSSSELFRAKKSLLSSVCDAYFNIINEASKAFEQKVDESEKSRARTRKPPPALSSALKGLLRVASFISMEVIEAILGALTPLLETERLPLQTRFRCLSAAYAVLSIHSRLQQADPDSFTGDARAMDAALYKGIGCLYGPQVRAFDDEYITFDAIESLISSLTFRDMPLVRRAAMARRLCTLAASCASTHTCSIGLLRVAQLLLPPSLVSSIYKQRDDKSEGQQLKAGVGHTLTYDMDANDPEGVGADKSSAWELSSLIYHFHPTVRELSTLCASGYCGERLPKSLENVLLATKAHSSAKGGFNPPPSEKLKETKKVRKTRRSVSLNDNVMASAFRREEELKSFICHDDEAPGDCFGRFWQNNSTQ